MPKISWHCLFNWREQEDSDSEEEEEEERTGHAGQDDLKAELDREYEWVDCPFIFSIFNFVAKRKLPL